MAVVETTEIFNCSVDQLYRIITDYEKYPEFLGDVEDCEIIEEIEEGTVVEFTVSLIKKFKYRLLLKSNGKDQITWTLDSGDLFKASNGSWILEPEGDKAKVMYKLEVKFKSFVPGAITKSMVNVNLPNMMDSYHERVAELHS